MGGKDREALTQAEMAAHGAVIAALYVVLTIIFAPISFGSAQLRIAEALTILPMFTPAAVPGLFIGCIIANFIGGGIIVDIIPAIVSNTVIVPLVLRFGYGVNMPIPILALYIAIGEFLGCFVLGELLAQLLIHYGKYMFERSQGGE